MFKQTLTALLLFACIVSRGQPAPANFQNPILPGFSPDPSICRVGADYYLVNSSFIWFPGIPIYHSKDLVNWELIGHGITRPTQISFNKIKDQDGIWAMTIRYHNGLFYLVGTANNCGGNFYMTAKDPAGEWSDPVWLKDAPGIDASLFWDDDGKCYYTGNRYDFKKTWPAQCAIWIQELDLNKQALIGERKLLTYGYANNAANTEGPHLYKINGKYLLLTAEGGTDYYHAITAHHSNTLMGPYISDKINPVLSHRQLGKDYPIQAVGHGDLVQTQNGEWWAVVLGKRVADGGFSLTRETFLCKVQFEDGTPVFNPGFGKVLMEQQRPDLPWTPIKPDAGRDEFDSDKIALKWHSIRNPAKPFYTLVHSQLKLYLQPEVADSLACPAMLVQKIKEGKFEVTTKLSFKPPKDYEHAGLIIYRNANSYYMLMKDKYGMVLIRKDKGDKEIIAKVAYTGPEVCLKAVGNGTTVSFSFGKSLDTMAQIGGTQSLNVIAESSLNRFNGPGIGIYGSSNGNKSDSYASFDWFQYTRLK